MRVGLVALLLLLIAAGAPLTTAATPNGEDIALEEETATAEEAVRFRQTFGFDASPTLVRAAAADTAAYSTWPYGVPLSKAEIAEMGRRTDVQKAVARVVPEARMLPGYAGVYLDQLDGGQPVFLFTGATAQAAADEIGRLLPAGTAFRVQEAKRTESELIEQKQTIEADLTELWASGIDIVRVAVKTSQNRLRVGVRDLTESERQEILARYGSDLDVFEDGVAVSDACPATNDCRPIKGGISINHTGGAAGECTSGFIVRASDGTLRMLTAGHCIHVHGGYDTQWQHNSDAFGRARRETWTPGGTGNADVGLISIASAEQDLMTSKNKMRRTNDSVVSVIDTDVISAALEGSQACRVGRTSGHDCGIISEWLVGRASKVSGYERMWVTLSTTVNFDSLGGDSGGPVFYYDSGGTTGSVVALGTHVHSEEGSGANEGWFSGIYRGSAYYEELWGVWYAPCETAAC
jgi:V8-like Glu-specific endopeptidase